MYGHSIPDRVVSESYITEHRTTREQREGYLRAACFNPFLIAARDVLIDLLTDSGTGAMSSEQWAGVMRADESYAGAESFFRFRDALRGITGFENVLPTHQGRASERILFELVGGKGLIVPNNAHFDTTRANAEHSGAEARNLPIPEAADPTNRHPFKGNLNVAALEKLIDAVSAAGVYVSDPPTQGEVQAIVDKLDELISALRR